jgi:hypothetical protein
VVVSSNPHKHTTILTIPFSYLHDEKPTIIELIDSIKQLNKTTNYVGKERGEGRAGSQFPSG